MQYYVSFRGVCLLAKFLQSCLTLSDHMDCSPPGSSVHGIFQAKILEWVAIFLLQGMFPTQGLNSHLLHCRQILYCLNHQEAHTSLYQNPRGSALGRLGSCLAYPETNKGTLS